MATNSTRVLPICRSVIVATNSSCVLPIGRSVVAATNSTCVLPIDRSVVVAINSTPAPLWYLLGVHTSPSYTNVTHKVLARAVSEGLVLKEREKMFVRKNMFVAATTPGSSCNSPLIVGYTGT